MVVVRRFGLLVYGLLVFGASSVPDVASATSIVARTVPELTELSSFVVEATVGRQAAWMDASGPIYTETSLTVQRYLKGSGPAQLSVTQRGGVVGEFRDVIPGDMALRPGDRVVIFLQEKEGRLWSTLLGWSVFDVTGSGPTARVHRHASHMGLYRPSAEGYRPATPEQLATPETLGQLVGAVTEVRR